MEGFDEIRPYHDEEVSGAVQRLLGDAAFIDFLARFQAPTLSRLFPWLARQWARKRLGAEFGSVASVHDLQTRLYPHVDGLVRHTTAGLSVSGLEQLDPSRTHLFVSNHRDIVFDPTLVNYVLMQNGLETTRIAIGDNLLKNPVAAEMMRLNKSFVVKRNLSSPREMRDVYFTLSAYIRHSIESRHPVWIAQREGRAKDGIDRTDAAIIKMFFMSRKQEKAPFDDVIRDLSIVPVSISYEFDPCDQAKARELEALERTGEYVKGDNEDLDSIVKGIMGAKGRVHLAFGRPLDEAFTSAREVADALDEQIIGNYRLFSSNLRAYEYLRAEAPELELAPADAPEEETECPEMDRRLDSCEEALRPYLLRMYANPVISRQALKSAVKPQDRSGGEARVGIR